MEEIVNFKWSGKYVKNLQLFVNISEGEVKKLYGLVRMEKWWITPIIRVPEAE